MTEAVGRGPKPFIYLSITMIYPASNTLLLLHIEFYYILAGSR